MVFIYPKNISKVAVSLDSLVPDWWPSYDALNMKIWRDRKSSQGRYGIKRLEKGLGSGNEMLIDYDTLPREIQSALTDPRKSGHFMEQWYDWDADALLYYTQSFEFENGKRLSDEYIDRFTLNASVLKAVHEYREGHIAELAKKNKKPKAIYDWMAAECQCFQKTLKAKHNGIQHTLPPSGRAFRDVYNGFFTDDNTCNYRSLIDGRLLNENAMILTTETKLLLDSMFARSNKIKPNKAKVARMYQKFKAGKLEVMANDDTGELYDPAAYGDLSERSITKWLAQYESKAATLKLRSADRQKYNEIMKPSREMLLPQFAGTVLSIDDRQPPFEYAQSKRLWLYNGADVASQAITTTVFGKDKEGMMLEFYRQLVRNYTQWGLNLPWELEAETHLNSSFTNTFLRNGALFQKVNLIPNNARSKYIERINKEFRHDYEKEYNLWKGRPFARDESSQPMPYDNIYKKHKYVAYQSLVQQSLKVVEDWNNSEHPNHPGLTRWDYFMNRQHQNLLPTNWRAILPHLGIRTRSSCRVGKVALQNENRLIAENGQILLGEALLKKLTLIEGQDLTIYWLDGNDGNVMQAIAYLGDSYICELMPVPKYMRGELEKTPQCDTNRLIQDKYVSTVEAYINRRGNELQPITIIETESRTLNDNFQMPGLDRYIQPSEANTGDIIEDAYDEDMDEVPVYNNNNNTLLNNY